MPSNTAAWLMENKATSLEVKSAPYKSPGEHQIVIKNRAVAINPVDWAIQARGNEYFTSIKYPYIGGSDAAGEVVEIGSAVTRFKVGDRVVGMTLCLMEQGAFQEYPILEDHLASRIPDSLSYESASVLPLGLSTAASGMFQKDKLGLQLPTVPAKPTGKTLLVWGGSTSVGCCAIQLAVAAGYEVITTASPKNFDYVKSLGANQAFDYNSPTVITDIITAFKGKDMAGACAIGSAIGGTGSGPDLGPAIACIEIVSKCEGRKIVACAQPAPQELPEGVIAKFMLATTVKDDGVGKAVYVDFLGKALAEGTFVAAPEAVVVGKGLEEIQNAFEIQKKGVSAKKIVVSL